MNERIQKAPQLEVQGIHDRRGSKMTLRVVQAMGVIAVVATFVAIYSALKGEATFLLIMWAVWVIAPPAWFAWEYFYIYRAAGLNHDLSEFKTGQEAMAKVWVALVTLITGVLSQVAP